MTPWSAHPAWTLGPGTIVGTGFAFVSLCSTNHSPPGDRWLVALPYTVPAGQAYRVHSRHLDRAAANTAMLDWAHAQGRNP